MSGTPYTSSSDSALLRKVLGEHSGGSALEIGAGNGGNLVALAERFRMVVGTDLVRPVMLDWSEKGASFILTDGAACLRDAVFDLVAFNPPYVRAEVVDRTVDGGKDLEVPKEFLQEALRVVRPTGRGVFLLSDEADIHEFEGICSAKGFRVRKVAMERGFFEELSVYLAEPV
jgi:methylase of polypeptide subunit release factors